MAPKNSKFKPLKNPKPEPITHEFIPSTIPTVVLVPKVEIDDSKHPSVNNDHHANINVDDVKINNGVGNNGEEGEDEVVRQIDVYFNSPLDDDSKPLRPSWRSYELEESCEQVRVKPETSEVEAELSVQFDSKNYDNVDGDKAMPKQVLASTWQPQAMNTLTLGILMGNELHINPVHKVAQLRPSLQHLKLHASKKMNITHDDNMVASQWIPLEYHGETDQLSHRYMECMVAKEPSEIQFSINRSDYIDSFCPATSHELRSKVPSRRCLVP